MNHLIREGANKSKLNVGIQFHGNSYYLANADDHGLNAATNTTVAFPPGKIKAGRFTYAEVAYPDNVYLKKFVCEEDNV